MLVVFPVLQQAKISRIKRKMEVVHSLVHTIDICSQWSLTKSIKLMMTHLGMCPRSKVEEAMQPHHRSCAVLGITNQRGVDVLPQFIRRQEFLPAEPNRDNPEYLIDDDVRVTNREEENTNMLHL